MLCLGRDMNQHDIADRKAEHITISTAQQVEPPMSASWNDVALVHNCLPEVDLDKMETIIKVNGKQTGRFHTNEMIFGIVPFIVELTKYFTLWPGDVIWMGTDGASPDLKAGDVVEIDIAGIGTLRNKFVAETLPGKS